MKQYTKTQIVIIFLSVIILIFLGVFIFTLIDNKSEYDMDNALKYENKIINTLTTQDEVILEEIFDFSFHQAYVVEESYLAGDEFAQKYGLDISVEEMLPNQSENIKRIVFVDKNGEFVYEFRYNFGQRLCADTKGKVLHPDTIIRKTNNLTEVDNAFSIEFVIGENDRLIVDDEYFISNNYAKVISNYKNIINDLPTLSSEQIINKYYSPNSQLESEWEEMLKSITKRYSENKSTKYGYILMDINSDNMPELLCVDEDYNIFSILAAIHPSKNLLGAYSFENKCKILQNNQLFTQKVLDDSNFEYSIMHFDVIKGSLETSFKFGCEKGVYYKVEEDKKADISLDQFNELLNDKINTEVDLKTKSIHVF